MSAIDPWAEIARLQKELDAAVAYHDECGKLIEAALDTDARKYNEGGMLFEHYASDIHRIRTERNEAQRENKILLDANQKLNAARQNLVNQVNNFYKKDDDDLADLFGVRLNVFLEEQKLRMRGS